MNVYQAFKEKLIYYTIGASSNIKLGNNVIFKNYPSIRVAKDSKLVIGDHVLINSSNKHYHANMYAPVKILIDRKGASVEIGNHTRIHGSCLHAYKRIVIGKNCLIAANCQIFDGNGHDVSFTDPSNRINTTGKVAPVHIEDNVWIGLNVVILPGVTIGQGSVIAANSVVHKDIPPMCIAGGNPAKIIKYADK